MFIEDELMYKMCTVHISLIITTTTTTITINSIIKEHHAFKLFSFVKTPDVRKYLLSSWCYNFHRIAIVCSLQLQKSLMMKRYVVQESVMVVALARASERLGSWSSTMMKDNVSLQL